MAGQEIEDDLWGQSLELNLPPPSAKAESGPVRRAPSLSVWLLPTARIWSLRATRHGDAVPCIQIDSRYHTAPKIHDMGIKHQGSCI
jgi:hypothetical protein